MADLKPPRGTRDILPPESERFAAVERAAADIFERAGYRRIITPMFEDTGIFERSIGEATDIVTKEMYTFTDRSGNSLTLRPEGTAPVMRAIVSNALWQQGLPIKLYYSAAMFRYERPQKGRFRQHHQLGIEAVGAEDPALDAEVIEVGWQALQAAGVGEATLLLNSMGHPECRAGYLPALREFLAAHRDGLDADCKRRMESNPLRVFDCKVPQDQAILTDAPMLEQFLCDACREHFVAVQQHLRDAGLSFQSAPRLVRGFDYYTRTTFEYQSAALEAAQNALGGGGRYDGLMEQLGGPALPGIGFGLGVDRMLLAQEEAKTIVQAFALVSYVIPLTHEEYQLAARVAKRLREKGNTEVEFSQRKLSDALARASKKGARTAVIIGPSERDGGFATLKDLTTGDQHSVPLDDLPARVGEILNS